MLSYSTKLQNVECNALFTIFIVAAALQNNFYTDLVRIYRGAFLFLKAAKPVFLTNAIAA